MLRKILFASCFNLLSVLSYSQQIEFMFDKKPLNSIDSLEAKVGGLKFNYNYQIGLADDYVKGVKGYQIANPLIFKRDLAPFTGRVSYHFSVPDSVLRLVEYEWEGNKQTINELQDLFKKNQKFISEQLEDQHPGFKEDRVKEEGWFRITDNWETDKTYIKQFVLLGSGTYRVRVMITWK